MNFIGDIFDGNWESSEQGTITVKGNIASVRNERKASASMEYTTVDEETTETMEMLPDPASNSFQRRLTWKVAVLMAGSLAFMGALVTTIAQRSQQPQTVSGGALQDLTQFAATHKCPDGYTADTRDIFNGGVEANSDHDTCAKSCTNDDECQGYEFNPDAKDCITSKASVYHNLVQNVAWETCIKNSALDQIKKRLRRGRGPCHSARLSRPEEPAVGACERTGS